MDYMLSPLLAYLSIAPNKTKRGRLNMAKSMNDVDERKPTYPQAEQLKKEDILGKEILIKEFTKVPSSMNATGFMTVILAELDGKEISFVGATAIDSALERNKDKLPITDAIIKTKSKSTGRDYFTFKSQDEAARKRIN